jgi:TatD DNase family protein
VIDSHCHIAGEEFAADLPAVVERARAAGVTRALVILAAEDDAEIDRTDTVLSAWPECRFAVGVHPHHARVFESNPQVAADTVARRLDGLPAARAIGEIGLDYHYDFSPREVQHDVFRVQIRLALERGLPVVIHTREAEDDTLRIIQEEGQGEVTRRLPLLHGRSGGRRTRARDRLLPFDSWCRDLSEAETLRQAAAAAPADRLLVETDSPYLAPIPYRGKRNEPSYVAKVVELLAALRGTTATPSESRPTATSTACSGRKNRRKALSFKGLIRLDALTLRGPYGEINERV